MRRLYDAFLPRLIKTKLCAPVSYLQWFLEVHGPRRHVPQWMCFVFFVGVVTSRYFFCYPSSTGIVVESKSTLLNGVQANRSQTYAQVEDQFFREVERTHVRCDVVERIGSFFDGGWDVCLASFFKPRVSNCLIYSFGVEYNFGYDEYVAKKFKCVVRAFDPSMGIKSHVHIPGPVHFYNFALGGSNTVWEEMFERSPTDFKKKTKVSWSVRTLDSLMGLFQESHKVIDILKVDVEYSEWDAFEQMLQTGVLKNVKVLMFEIHTKELLKSVSTKDDFLRYLAVLRGIEKIGFRKYKSHFNKLGVSPMRDARTREGLESSLMSYIYCKSCCYELYYVNMNFIF